MHNRHFLSLRLLRLLAVPLIIGACASSTYVSQSPCRITTEAKQGRFHFLKDGQRFKLDDPSVVAPNLRAQLLMEEATRLRRWGALALAVGTVGSSATGIPLLRDRTVDWRVPVVVSSLVVAAVGFHLATLSGARVNDSINVYNDESCGEQRPVAP